MEMSTMYSPANGVLLELSKLQDKVFSTGMMGNGFIIKSENSLIYSPLSGKVSHIADTKHAIVISTDEFDVMIHIGIDTCNLKGIPFDIVASKYQEVQAGDLLMKVDYEYIREKQLDSSVIVIFLERDDINISEKLPKEVVVNQIITIK